jgi:transcription elongation factor Elf1
MYNKNEKGERKMKSGKALRCSKCNGLQRFSIKKLENNYWLFTCLNCGAWAKIYAKNEKEAIKSYNSLKNVFA